MIYRGFNQRELARITEILDRNHVAYDVSIPDDAVEKLNDSSQRLGHRFMDSINQIEIDASEFDKLSAADRQRLFDLRIYKEEESPFTEEELAELSTAPAGKPGPTEKEKLNRWASLAAAGVLVALYLLKKGFLK